MPRQQARPAALPPKWGRDAMRRAAVFCGLLAGSLALGTAIVWRVFAPPPETPTVSAMFEQPSDAQLSVDSEGLRKAIAQSDRIEAGLQSVRLPKSYDLHMLASRVAVRLNVAAASKEGTQACRVTLNSVPGLTGRQAAALLDALLAQYVDDLRDARVAIAKRHDQQARARVDEARKQLDLAQRQADELMERVATAPPAAPAAANAAAMVPEVLIDKAVASAQRAEAERQWVELRARREVLLERRTPVHPEVVDVDERIAAVAARLEALQNPPPANAAQAAPAANWPATVDASTVDTAAREGLARARAACQRAETELAQAGRAEREAHDALVHAQVERPEIATPAVVPASTVRQPLAPWLLANLAAGLLLAGGAAMMVRPATLRSAAEVQRVLGTPVIGILPADLLQSSAAMAEAA